MPEKPIELTGAEWTIIKAVWDTEPCTAPAIQEKLFKRTAWAYSTVRTLMDRMVAKGLLAAEKKSNQTLYRTAVTRAQAQRGELLYALKHAFNGALTPMVQCLLDTNEVSRAELDQIKQLIAAHEKTRGKGGKKAMNPLLHWLTSPEWTSVVGALLHSLWQGAIIAIALAGLMRRLANPMTRYRCALAGLSLVFITGIVTWALLNASKPAGLVATPIPETESAMAPLATPAQNLASADIIVAFGRMSAPPTPKYWIACLALLWICGTAVMLLRAGIKVAGAEKLRRSCRPLNDERMVALVSEARRAVGLVRQIRVAVTEKLTSPAVVGVLVPTLILPLSLFTALTPEQIRFILLHELAHIRRGDYFANLFQLFTEALLFFNPAVWWISHQIRREREACCDTLAIESSGAPADYARTLVRVAENILQPANTAALAFGEGQREPSSLADRVQRLLVPGYRPTLRLTWRAMLVSLIVGGTLLVLSAVGTRSTVGAILSSTQSSTNNPVMLLNDPRSVARTGKTENSSAEISNDNSWADFQTVLPLPIFRVQGNGLPLPGIFTNGSSDSIPRVAVHNDDPFWTIGGNTDTYTGATPTTTAATQQRLMRSFEIDLNAFYAALRKSAGLPETTTGTNLTAVIRPFFAKAVGVHFDQDSGNTYFLSTSRGRMMIYATLPELDAIEVLLSTMKGTPLVVRTYTLSPDSLAKSANRLATEISSSLATNPAAGFRALLESFDPSDPRSKQVHFNPESRMISARATEADLDKFESVIFGPSDPAERVHMRTFKIDLSLVSAALGVRPMPAKPTNGSPAAANPTIGTPADESSGLLAALQNRMRRAGVDIDRSEVTTFLNERQGRLLVFATKKDLDTIEALLQKLSSSALTTHTFATSADDGLTNLQLRVYAVDAKAMVQALKAVGTDAEPGAKSTKDGRTLLPDIQKFFAMLGVELQPPKTVFFNEPKGQLLVHATQTDLDRIEQVVQAMNDQPPQVNIKVQFVEIPQSLVSSILPGFFTNNIPDPYPELRVFPAS